MRGLSGTEGAAAAPGAAAGPAQSAATAGDPAGELERTLREAIKRHRGRLVMLCSFQKEESVLIDELVRLLGQPPASDGGDQGAADGGREAPDAAAPAVRVVTIDTGVLFPETLETWRIFEQRFGVPIEVEDASGPGGPWTGPEHCCSEEAKVLALERALEGAEAWITGIRREQSPTRSGARSVERDEGRGLLKYNPLVSWSEREIWRRIHARELPYNPLHDRGYASIGCATCTLPGSGRDGRWAGTDKTECGLHLPATAAGVPVGSGPDAGNGAGG